GAVLDVDFSPDGRLVLSAGGRAVPAAGEVCLWETPRFRGQGVPLRHPQQVHAVAFSADSRLLVTACEDGKARLWDAATGEPQGPLLPAHRALVTAALEPDGRGVVLINADRTAHRWDAETGKPLTPLPRPPVLDHENRSTRHAAVSRDGHAVLLATD